MATRGKKPNSSAHRGETVRASKKVELGSLVKLCDDGSNAAEWKDSLNTYFQSEFEKIGRFLDKDSTGYYVRPILWTPAKIRLHCEAFGLTERQTANFRKSKADDFAEQEEKDILSYSRMCGIVKATLSLSSRRLLRQHPDFAAVDALEMPKELVDLIMRSIVINSIGRTDEENHDMLIAKWMKMECGSREDAVDFCARAEQLWNALEAAHHPTMPSLVEAIRYVTKKLTNNPRYSPYVADVLNSASKPATAADAYAKSFAEIPGAAARYYHVGAHAAGASARGGVFVYACTGCGNPRHSEDECWKLHPELRPSKLKSEGGPSTCATEKSAKSSDMPQAKAETSGKPRTRGKRGGKNLGKGREKSMTAYSTLTEAMAFGLDL